MRNLPILFLLMRIPLAASGPNIGDRAPALQLSFPLATSSGQAFSLKNPHGKAVVLDFWATWCAPCVQQIPRTNELVKASQALPVEFIAITDESETVVRCFLQAHPISALVALDTGGETAKSYDVQFLPMAVLIDRRGTIAAITNPSNVDAGVLKQLVAGKPIHLTAPVGREPGTPVSRTAGDPSTLFQASFRESEQTDDDLTLGFGRLAMQGATLRTMLSRTFEMPPERIELTRRLEDKHYDALVESPALTVDELREAVRQLLPSALHLKIRQESRVIPVLVLAQTDRTSAMLIKNNSGEEQQSGAPGSMKLIAVTLNALASSLQHELHKNVVDETGLTGKYDLTLTWNAQDLKSVLDAVQTQLGLSLVEGTRSIPFLIVEQQ